MSDKSPRTEAGKRLLAEPWWSSRYTPSEVAVRDAILAIEAEAAEPSEPGSLRAGGDDPDWPYRFVVDRKQYERLVKVEVAAIEVLAAMDERPPEGPQPTTAEVERWYIANDGRITRALAVLRAALSTEGVTR